MKLGLPPHLRAQANRARSGYGRLPVLLAGVALGSQEDLESSPEPPFQQGTPLEARLSMSPPAARRPSWPTEEETEGGEGENGGFDLDLDFGVGAEEGGEGENGGFDLDLDF